MDHQIQCMTLQWVENNINFPGLEGAAMSDKWFARPVLYVADIDRSIDFRTATSFTFLTNRTAG